ncbi:histamine H3 receptor-like [Babylonia areolata]|uniref:histamine H3 receptor-like n=1 Tax=Babylonia areolata TaxID=304850 RepID=UPI003FD5D058
MVRISTVQYEDGDSDARSVFIPMPWTPIFLVYCLSAIVTAVCGNLLIVLSFWRDRRLRTVQNMYLLNLAVCDLTVGAVSMPIYLVYTVLNFRWILGVAMCRLFLAEDNITTTMASMIVILVAWDRLSMLSLGAHYQETSLGQRQDAFVMRKHAYIKLTVCWFCCFLIFSLPVLSWAYVAGQSVVPKDDCDVEYKNNEVFVILQQLISFLVPFVSLTVINGLILVALKKRMKVRPAPVPIPTVAISQLVRSLVRTDGKKDSATSHSDHQKSTSTSSRPTDSSFRCSSANTRSNCPPADPIVTKSHGKKRKRERRVSVILIGLVLAMAIFWLPYTVTTIVLTLCEDCVNLYLYEVFIWWLWTKSCINPFLYAYHSPLFRYNFKQLLLPVGGNILIVLPYRRGRRLRTVHNLYLLNLADVVTGSSTVEQDECDVEFRDNEAFVIVLQLISFLIPFVSLTDITNLLIVQLETKMKVGQTPIPKLKVGLA